MFIETRLLARPASRPRDATWWTSRALPRRATPGGVCSALGTTGVPNLPLCSTDESSDGVCTRKCESRLAAEPADIELVRSSESHVVPTCGRASG